MTSRLPRATVCGSGVPQFVLGPGDALLVGREPQAAMPADDPAARRRAALPLPYCAPYVSRVLGELTVGTEAVRLHWRGRVQGQLSSLFDAPGGARRVTLTAGMAALLDAGENHLRVLRGRQVGPGRYADLLLIVDVAEARPDQPARPEWDAGPSVAAPGLSPGEREWYVALALAEPWLTGADDYPRPPSNREIYERVLGWHGYAWNLRAPQRVDDAIRAIAPVAFGRHDDPFRSARAGRVSNLRFAVGRRIAEVQLVTAADLAAAERGVALHRPRSAG